MGAKPLPKLGQTRAILDEFVKTGKMPANNEAEESRQEPSYEPRQEHRQEPMHRPMHKPMNIHESLSGSDEHATGLCDSVRRRRTAQRERIVQRGYSVPESLANRVRIAAASEELTCTEIVVEALTAWLSEYERSFGGGENQWNR